MRGTAALVAILGFALAIVSLVALAAAGLGYRWGLWELGAAFAMLRWAAYGGIAAAAVSLLGCFLTGLGGRRGLAFAAAGLALGAVVFAMPAGWLQVAQSVPPIHDITTDTVTPPPLVALLERRAGAPNPAAYGGPEVAAQQKAAYPDIAPADLPVPPAQAFARAHAAAETLGWSIVAENQGEGRIEATDRTLWFGFTDDIVIRIAARDGGSRVDIRSVSRVGRSDIGTNARRVRRFLREIAEG